MQVVAFEIEPVQQVPQPALPSADVSHAEEVAERMFRVDWGGPAENAERTPGPGALWIRNLQSEPHRAGVVVLRPIEVDAALVFAFDDESVLQVAHAHTRRLLAFA